MARRTCDLAEGAAALVHTRWWKLVGALAALVAAGLVPAPGMEGSPYVLVPYAAALLCVGLAARKFAQLVSPLDPRKKRDLTDHVRSLARRLVAGIVAVAVTALGEAAHVVMAGGLDAGSVPWTALLLALMAVAECLLASLRRDVEALPTS